MKVLIRNYKVEHKLKVSDRVYAAEVLLVIQYSTSCQKWVHKKCSGIKGSMYKVMKSSTYTGCSNPVTSTGRTSVDIGASANLELVDKFCYLGDVECG